MKKSKSRLFLSLASSVTLLVLAIQVAIHPAAAQTVIDPAPPAEPVRLIFIHHSTGENWLRDDYGGLGMALAENNYFVSDTNYGWGPDSIGDRTDIPNWAEWFASDQTDTIMDAVYYEGEQHSDYTRLSDAPTGENVIIMFKSCFPNSALEGNPNDPPDPEGWLSVGHAKYVYNQILPYFADHPDKLFIVVTAPPLSDRTYADNARAFNEWLVNDWLEENQYTLDNVAVFDFYNVLTANQAHHWYNDGEIQHIVTSKNTLHYPSGDDHPNERGSQKATEEFIPLLNIYYNNWIASGNAQLPVGSSTTTTDREDEGEDEDDDETAGVPLPPEMLQMIDDLESGAAWEAYRDEATTSTITCQTDPGSGLDGSTSLLMDYNITPGSWGTCALFFDAPQDWSEGGFLQVSVYSSEPRQVFSIAVHTGSDEAQATYHTYMETSTYTDGYVEYTARWDELLRPDWEENAGTALTNPTNVIGVSFGVGGSEDENNTGTIHFDNLALMRRSASSETADDIPSDEGQDQQETTRQLPCMSILLVPLVFIGFTLLIRRR